MKLRGARATGRRLALLLAVASVAAVGGPAAPAAARAVAAPVSAVPASASGAPGETVTLRGTLRQVVGDDFRSGTSTTSWFVRTATGRVPLVVPDGGMPALAGQDAVITGTRLPDGSVRVRAAEPATSGVGMSEPAATGLGSSSSLAVAGAKIPAATSPAGGVSPAAWSGPAVRHIAVIAATYTDLPDAPGVVANLVPALTGASGSIRSLFAAASRGRVTVDADVFGPWALGFSSCSVANTFAATIDAIEAQAATHGVALARYDDVIMWTPPPCGTTWVALGEAPGTYIQVSAPHPDTLDSRRDEFAWTTSHEMGHNMGLMHANALQCLAGSTPTTFGAKASCRTIEYGDPFSTMGGGQGYGTDAGWDFISPLFDAPELERLGWLDPDDVRVVTGPGTYSLVAVYGAADGVRLLKIRRSTAVLASDPNLSYWPLRAGWLEIELRGDTPDGTWDTIPRPTPVPDGVMVRYVEDGFSWSDLGAGPQDGPSYIVDAHPATTAANEWDPGLLDTPIGPGDPVTITDPAGTTIGVVTLTGTGAQVSVSFSASPPAATVYPAPVITSATAGAASATVTWSAPTPPAGTTISGYSVRSYPGGRECYARPGDAPLRCTVTGLVNETAYRFTVTAAYESGGYWATSEPSDPLTPIGPPTAVVASLPLYRSSQAIAVRWTGSYRGGPVDAVDVRYRVAAWNASFGAHVAWRSGTTATSATLTGTPGRTYCFSARATVAGPGWGPWGAERCAAVPLDDRALKVGAGWTPLTGSAYYRGTALRTSTAGRSLTRTTVVAKHVALVASTCPTCGSVKVYWNGAYQRTVSLHGTVTKNRVVLGLLAFSSVRSGTLKLVVAKPGKRVTVDGVLITGK